MYIYFFIDRQCLATVFTKFSLLKGEFEQSFPQKETQFQKICPINKGESTEKSSPQLDHTEVLKRIKARVAVSSAPAEARY